MLANGAVIFIVPNICRRTIPGGIAARGVTELPPAPALPPAAPLVPAPEPGVDPGAAVDVGKVCRVLPPADPEPEPAGVLLPPPPGIKGVETRVLTELVTARELVTTGVELEGCALAVDDET